MDVGENRTKLLFIEQVAFCGYMEAKAQYEGRVKLVKNMSSIGSQRVKSYK
jgi:hypothetical protein